MSDWAVGLSTGIFWQTSIFECLEDIRNAGFGRIELSLCLGPFLRHRAAFPRVVHEQQRIRERGV